MKIAGRKLEGPNIETVVIPRQDGDIVFKCQAVLSYDDFEKLCPMPTPPEVLKPGGVQSFNTEDPKYVEAVQKYSEQRTSYMVLQSLSATEGLEWGTVKMDDPSTWDNYTDEMAKAGLSDAECARIIHTVTSANGLNQKRIDEATERFLAAQVPSQ